MDEVSYTFKVNVAGTASSVEVSTANGDGASSAGSFQAGAQEEDEISAGGVVSQKPGSLIISQLGSGIPFGADIVLQASVEGTTDTLWVDTDEDIIASQDSLSFTDPEDYEWPNAAVSADITTETAITTLVTIHLKSVPVYIFDWGVIYVRLTVHFRDVRNDMPTRRVLRGLQQQDVGSIPQEEATAAGAADMIAKVTFATDDSGCVTVSSFMIVSSTTLAAGAAAFLLI